MIAPLLLVLLLFLIPTANAATRNANPGNIQTQINATVSGDTLILDPGTYTTPMRFTSQHSGATLRGGAGVVIEGQVDEDLINFDSQPRPQNFTIDGNGMVLDGLTQSGCGIHIYGGGHVVRNLEIKFVGTHGLCGNPLNSTFTNLNVHHSGVLSNMDRSPACSRALGIPHSPAEHGHCHGMYFFSGSTEPRGNSTFTGGSYSNSDGIGLHSYDAGLFVNGVKFINNWGHGIITLNTDVQIVNSLFTGNGFFTWTGLSYMGIYTGNTSNVRIYNNTITQNTNGILTTGGNTTIRNNIIYNNSDSNLDNSGGSPNISANLCNSGCSINANPQFVNATAGDFHLQGGSPAIDSGIDLSSIFTNDFDGNTRQPPWDLGALDASGQTPCVCTTGAEACCPPPNPMGLVGWFDFDNNFNDKSGKGHNLTVSGVTANGTPIVDSDLSTPGVQGNSVVLNGTTGSLSVSHADFRPVTSVGLSAWVKTTGNVDTICRIISATNAATSQYTLGYRKADGLPFCDANNVGFTGTKSILDGQNHHLACGKEGSTIRLWVDGVNVASVPSGGNMAYTGTETLTIGTVTGRRCQTTLDQPRIYANQDMTATDVANLFAEAPFVPISNFSVTRTQWTQADADEGAFIGAQDGNLSNVLSNPFGYRWAQHYAGNPPTPTSECFYLFCRRNGGSWTQVTNSFGSLGVRIHTDSKVGMGSGTCPKLPTDGLVGIPGKFVAGTLDPALCRLGMTNGQHAEFEWRLDTGSPAQAGDTIQCRPHREDFSDFGANNYLIQPTLTVLADPSPLNPAQVMGPRIIGGGRQ